MESAKQKFRPKHATLILKCYPRYTKSAPTVQPNSSELNYLLYYASTRRSKLQKVGAFLQKKTDHDLYKDRQANVQVTLQILHALINKLPQDLPLYASFVLDILKAVLVSEDLTLVEESVPAFEAFCQHQDVAALAASQAYLDHFEEVVRKYAGYAALKTPVHAKGGFNTPTAIRWRVASLKALKSVTASEMVGADGGRQLKILMPAILQNLHSGDPDHLLRIQQQAASEEGTDKFTRENARRRRMSVATTRTSEKSRPNSALVDGAGDDPDAIAEEEVGLLALQCLKQVFSVNNRLQIRLGTDAMLQFVYTEASMRRPGTSRSGRFGLGATWSTTLVEAATQWTPMQDRFVILVTIMETLNRLETTDENLNQQLHILSLVDWLLRSNINMIGLSVMDVLLGLLRYLKSLLQYSFQASELPQHQQADPIELFDPKVTPSEIPCSPVMTENSVFEDITPTIEQLLLIKVRRSIAALAMHVYYADQVADLVHAMLERIRPFAPVVSGQRSERSDLSDEGFTSGTAKLTALNAVKEALVVANTKGSVSGGAAMGRTRVGINSWLSTKWLLQDPDARVRRAYVETLLTWCRLEKTPQDVTYIEDKSVQQSSPEDATPGRQTTGFLQEKYPEIYTLAQEIRHSDRELSLLEGLIQLLESKKDPAITPPNPLITENGMLLVSDPDKSDTFSPHLQNSLVRRLSFTTSTSQTPSQTPPAKPTVRFERLRQIMYQERGTSPGRTIGSNTQSMDFSYHSSRPSSSVSKTESQYEDAKQEVPPVSPISPTTEERQIEERTITTRPSTSSSREDPEVNALALKGARLSVDASGEIPPVPPLPAGLMAGKKEKETGEEQEQRHQHQRRESGLDGVDLFLRSIVVDEKRKGVA